MDQQPGSADGRQHLLGWPIRNYDHLIATLRRAWLDQRLTLGQIGERAGCHRNQVSVVLAGTQEAHGGRLLDLTHALGYDLALVPRQPATVLTRDDEARGSSLCDCPSDEEGDWDDLMETYPGSGIYE